MKVRWSAGSRQDRRDIWNNIAAENPAAAERMDAIFSAAAASLSELPHRGRKGNVSGTRELMPHENYRLVYEIDGDTVLILAVIHAAREWPPTEQT